MNVFSKAKIEDGFLQVHIANFIDLVSFAQYFHRGVGKNYFRGQSDARWGLTTTLERFEATLLDDISGTDNTILKIFKKQLRGRGVIPRVDPSSDDELLALGQHYGLPTPLLDWSESFYIALFFAYADEFSNDCENVAIWGMHTYITNIFEKFNENSALGKGGEPYPELKLIDPFTEFNDRLLSQTGVFVKKPSNLSVVDVVKNYCKGNSSAPVLSKITMPSSEREIVLNNLDAMNINWSTIYPGFEGAAKNAKLQLQMLNRKVERMGGEGLKRHLSQKITQVDLD